MLAGADIEAHINSPHKCTVELVSVNKNLTGSAAGSSVLCIGRIPQHYNLILAVAIEIAVFRVTRCIGTLVNAVSVHLDNVACRCVVEGNVKVAVLPNGGGL